MAYTKSRYTSESHTTAATHTSPATGGNNSLRRRGIILVFVAGCLWSVGGLIIRQLEAATDWQIIFYRSLGLAFTLLVVLWRRHPGRLKQEFARAGWAAVVAGLNLSTAFVGIIFAFSHTTVANSLFLLASAPLIAAILARLLLKEPVSRITWITMSAAMLGICLMVANGLALGTFFGNLMGLTSAVGSAGFIVALRWGRRADMLVAIFYAGLIAAAAGLILSDRLTLSLHDLGFCLLYGAGSLALGLSLFTLGSPLLSAAELGLLSLMEVVLGPVWVWLSVGEVPAALTLVGGGVVLGAIVVQALWNDGSSSG